MEGVQCLERWCRLELSSPGCWTPARHAYQTVRVLQRRHPVGVCQVEYPENEAAGETGLSAAAGAAEGVGRRESPGLLSGLARVAVVRTVWGPDTGDSGQGVQGEV